MQALYPDTLAFARPPEALEASLDAVERHLAALGSALRDRDAAAIDQQASALHRALAATIHRFSQASRQPGGVPQPLRERLAMASGQVAAQRESLARATAALDRAIDVLMPTPVTATTYGEGGHNERSGTSGCLHA
jgi:phage-related tail protein